MINGWFTAEEKPNDSLHYFSHMSSCEETIKTSGTSKKLN